MKNRPADFTPPYPAYAGDLNSLPDGVCMAQIAVQYGQDANALEIRKISEKIEKSFSTGAMPTRYERCHFSDQQQFHNQIYITYWSNSDNFLQWRQSAQHFLTDSATKIGWWIEAFSCPISNMETSYSNEMPDWGMAQQCTIHLDPDHGYFGGMRDRIKAAEDNGLPAEMSVWPGGNALNTTSRHFMVNIPDNSCFIRTVQGWNDSPEAQKQDYFKSMMPVYEKGVAYLRDNPKDSNCLGARLVEIQAPDNKQIQTQTLAWFLGLKDLERWAHEHPTHLAILTGMTDFAARYDNQISLVLGHEVYVIPKGRSHAEYYHCHEQTGLLPYFSAQIAS